MNQRKRYQFALGLLVFVFVLMIVFTDSSIGSAFISAGIIMVIFLAVSDPNFEKWQENRRRKHQEEQAIKRQSYLEEKGRLQAYDDHKQEKKMDAYYRKNPFGPSLFESEMRPRKRRKKRR